jgi:hypothetical protein
MSEETKTENAQSAPMDANAGNVGETTSIIERASQAAQRLEQANKKSEELLTRQEALFARQQLGGRSENLSKPKTREEELNDQIQERVNKSLAKYNRK